MGLLVQRDLVVLPGVHHDLDVAGVRVFFQMFAHLVTPDTRQHIIQDNQIGCACARHLQRHLSIFGLLRVITGTLQDDLQQTPRTGIVIDNEDQRSFTHRFS